ncbi:hypothetical protein FACS1894156_8310 [Bacteroidia bacterium]|nr:hypothetical protein FACS1894156_8310 [Bacteroidia bacterium]
MAQWLDMGMDDFMPFFNGCKYAFLTTGLLFAANSLTCIFVKNKWITLLLGGFYLWLFRFVFFEYIFDFFEHHGIEMERYLLSYIVAVYGSIILFTVKKNDKLLLFIKLTLLQHLCFMITLPFIEYIEGTLYPFLSHTLQEYIYGFFPMLLLTGALFSATSFTYILMNNKIWALLLDAVWVLLYCGLLGKVLYLGSNISFYIALGVGVYVGAIPFVIKDWKSTLENLRQMWHDDE